MSVQAQPGPGVCIWTIDDWARQETACGYRFEFGDGGPFENECVYCPYCGRKIEVDNG